ncbi:peptidase M23 [Ventosimonas gracilis]|uniref:Peptidase M23 n=1 Tax=Ventosimonas gracilis TaxID=1680762 RepID=A0A139SSA8_9GAMM|nr:peptidoglycan DD-metalloendopeptidase family protein [Ventosimonas gracilis]KXU37479.1 peptidase M23 [Ventosimonas gracilis]
MSSIKTVTKAYPKSHLFTACTLFFLLALAFFVFPSKEVAAYRGQSTVDPGQNLADANDPLLDDDDNNQATVEAASETASASLAEIDEKQKEQPLKHSLTVAKGDTLSTLFAKVGLGANDLSQVLASSAGAKRFSRLNIGQVLEFTLDEQGALLGLSSKLSALETLVVDKTENGFSFERKLTAAQIEERYAHGIIEKSLLEDASAAGLSYALALNMANLFNYDIDFARDIQPGDEFELIYQQKRVDGEEVGIGHILAARFINRGKIYTAVRHVDARGQASYYRADGSSTRKAFIRTPVDFTRISSRFSLGRKHPILNRIRAHKGVDYAAAQGTPIKATGNGKILFAGKNNGYGNYILIQHGKHYQTLYGHMRSFAKGMRTGASVQQGQIIGYVGMTGLATGPHLHYEFRVNGVHVDPLSHKLPTADPIVGKEKQRFLQRSQPLLARMDLEKNRQLALRKP